MASFITQNTLKLIKNLVLLAGFLACHATVQKEMPASNDEAKLALPSGQLIKVQLALTAKQQIQGLSGIRSEDFPEDSSLLFFYKEAGPRSFWMPDTYFDLDIIFLDENLKILDIERSVKAHPGRNEPPEIARTRNIWARHVLEIKAGSPASKSIQIGDTLKWISKSSLSEIESSIRPEQ